MIKLSQQIDSVCIGTTACVVEVECVAMSFVIGILLPDQSDIVFCGEGKVIALINGHTDITEETTFPVGEDFLKTLALNPKLCLGLSGYDKETRWFLQVLLPDLPWKDCAPKDPPTNFVDRVGVARGTPLLDIGMAECCQRITTILTDSDPGERLHLMVGGREGGSVSPRHVKHRNGKYEALPTALTYGDAPGFKPSKRFSSTPEIVNGIVALDSLAWCTAESLLLKVVETVADHSISCNKNITFRRLSKGFIKEGREIVSN